MSDAIVRRLLLGGVVAASAAVVWVAFQAAPHTGGDNSAYLSLAHALLTDGTYVDAYDPERLPHTKYPPVFPALLALLMALGARSWVAFKAVAAVSTVAVTAAAFLWAERRVGTLGAAGVAALLAVSSAVVYYSHWILSDPLFLALTLAGLLCLERSRGGRAFDGWLAAGVVLAGLAYFTRQAGLPLLVAALAWLALRRRWRALAVCAVGLGVPALAWWLRGRGAPVPSYADEFWMVNPYDPAQGTVGLLGLVPRVFANLRGYALAHVPAGIVGGGGPWVAPLGVTLSAATVGGWLVSLRREVGPTELFAPLYAGLVLLWPEVWSGDRFALPLFPLVFLYGAESLRWLVERLPTPARGPLAAAALLALLLPAAGGVARSAREASACAARVRAAGSFGCYGPGVTSFVDAATWSGASLPRGSSVLSRKPRHFYVLSGLPSRTFPFLEDPDELLRTADATGARYVLLDGWDGQAARYVGAAVVARPQAFCFVRGFPDDASPVARLLGIVPRAERRAGEPGGPGGVRIERCDSSYVRAEADAAYPSASSSVVPLLASSGS